MNALAMMRRRFETLPIEEFIFLTAAEARPVLEDMNAEQLMRGVDATEKDITPKYRNPLYAQAKQFMNSKPKPGTPDLRNTGEFHAGITATVTREGIEITGTEQKTEMLQMKYGDAIIGLSPTSLEEFKTGYLGPGLQDLTIKYLRAWLNG